LIYRYFPKTKEELAEIIKSEVERKGWNCDLNHIDTSKITDMSYLFSSSYGYNLEYFNGDISRWDVSNVTNMNWMFYNTMFIGDISKWKPIKVKDMGGMFWGFGNENSKFNAKNFDISKWDVSSVTDMNAMFAHSSFNSDISNWNVRSVLDMRQMFMYSDFCQDISKWEVNTRCETYDIFDNCPLDKGDFPDKYKPEGI
jgi:surface protein